MTMRHIVAIGTALALALTGTAFAGTAGVNWPTVRHLPTTASVEKSGSYGFRVKPATRSDLDGKSTDGIPAWDVSESVSGMSWAGDEYPDPPPAFVMHASADLRREVALFNGQMGWLVVPRGWHIIAGSIGIAGGGNNLLFAAPGGASDGWVDYFNAGVGEGPVLGSANGLFPDAHRRYDEFIGRPTPKLRLSPQPISLIRPNRCTALLTYSDGNLIVKGVALNHGDEGDAQDFGFISFFIALPKYDAALQDFLIAAFRAPSPASGPVCPPKDDYRQRAKPKSSWSF